MSMSEFFFQSYGSRSYYSERRGGSAEHEIEARIFWVKTSTRRSSGAGGRTSGARPRDGRTNIQNVPIGVFVPRVESSGILRLGADERTKIQQPFQIGVFVARFKSFRILPFWARKPAHERAQYDEFVATLSNWLQIPTTDY